MESNLVSKNATRKKTDEKYRQQNCAHLLSWEAFGSEWQIKIKEAKNNTVSLLSFLFGFFFISSASQYFNLNSFFLCIAKKSLDSNGIHKSRPKHRETKKENKRKELLRLAVTGGRKGNSQECASSVCVCARDSWYSFICCCSICCCCFFSLLYCIFLPSSSSSSSSY